MRKETGMAKSRKAELRTFGLVVGIAFAVLGGLLLWRRKDHPRYLLALSGAFLFFALCAPQLLGPVRKVWMTLAAALGWVTTRVILSLLFYLVITPVGFAAKLAGKRFLDLEFERDAHSYWMRREHHEKSMKNYERQF
jgi:hypothetical protein